MYIKLLPLVLQPKIMEWTEPVQKLFLQHCARHKKFHENVIECKKVGDQITIDRLSPNLHDLISIHSIPSQCKSQRISAIHATNV